MKLTVNKSNSKILLIPIDFEVIIHFEISTFTRRFGATSKRTDSQETICITQQGNHEMKLKYSSGTEGEGVK